jgi:hypothetical protein
LSSSEPPSASRRLHGRCSTSPPSCPRRRCARSCAARRRSTSCRSTSPSSSSNDPTATIPDCLWREQRVAIEADGVTWHDHKLTREHDAHKQARLEAAGYRVLRISWQQISHTPEQTVARIRAALR